jgi:hypothetical protein
MHHGNAGSTAPLLAVIAIACMAVAPGHEIVFALTVLLWLTFLVGLIGL